jgi:two-component system alkaline phosphatase synthesis response regulator PhoP
VRWLAAPQEHARDAGGPRDLVARRAGRLPARHETGRRFGAVTGASARVSKRLLLIEDEPGLVLTLTDRLLREGYEVESAEDGETGLERASAGRFDLILLDLGLPRRDGFDVCRDLRQRGIETPIIMLTARGQVIDKVVGLKLGADDYIAKPFEMLELLARIEARLRRSPPGSGSDAGETYRFGDVAIDWRKAEVYRAGRPVPLSAREFQLLRYFVEHRGATLSRDELLNRVWGYQAMPSTRTVDVHVAWLRQKIEPNPRHPQFLLTVHGLGYKFVG